MRERLLRLWAIALIRASYLLQRALVRVTGALRRHEFRKAAAEFHADIERIRAEAAVSERKLREQ